MKPTLTVEGKVRKVTCINFYDETQPTVMVECEYGYEIKEMQSNELGDLIWEGRYKPVIDTLNAHLEDSEQYLLELKMRIANEVLNTDLKKLSHVDLTNLLKTLTNFSEEHRNHKQYIDGVAASIELVNEVNLDE